MRGCLFELKRGSPVLRICILGPCLYPLLNLLDIVYLDVFLLPNARVEMPGMALLLMGWHLSVVFSQFSPMLISHRGHLVTRYLRQKQGQPSHRYQICLVSRLHDGVPHRPLNCLSLHAVTSFLIRLSPRDSALSGTLQCL